MKVFTLVLALVWGVVFPLVAQEAGRLTVVGYGNSESVPDMATISLGVTSEARGAAAALASNSADIGEMLRVIENSGVPARDIQTSGLSLSPVWNNRSSGSNTRPAIVGYTANNQITVKVRDLDTLGAILDAVVGAGANRFNGLQFGLQDPVPVADIARMGAVADAVRKARLYADAAGVTLGPIVEIFETGGNVPRSPVLREMALSAAVPIAGGEISVTASVTMVFEISR